MGGRVPGSGRVLVLALAWLLAGCAASYQPMGPALGPARLAEDPARPERLAIVAADGYRLPLRRWMPEDRPRAVVLALHGFNDYSAAFDGAGPFLAARGIATYAYDQRGFGATENPGIWPGTATLVSDLGAAARLVRGLHPDVPLYLLGESMGGAVVMLALTGPEARALDVAGTVLVAPAVWARETMPGYQQAALWLTLRLLPWFPVSGNGLGILPSDNLPMLRQMARDPLVLKQNRIDTVDGLVVLMSEAFAAAARFDVPALILYGDKEEVIPREPIDAMLRRLPANGPVVAFYPKGYHMLLRDLQGEVVLGDITAWIFNPSAPLPSGADAHGRQRLAGLPDGRGAQSADRGPAHPAGGRR